MKLLMTLVAFTFFFNADAHAFLKEGESLPHTLEASDQNNVQHNFDTIKRENGAVLVFVRSADWCPFCQQQLIDMNKVEKEIETLGYGLASISYDNIEELAKFSKKQSIAYPMLSDTNSQIIKAFDILNEEMEQGTKGYGIPHPAVYIINAEGVVVARFAEEGYKKRPPSSLILEKLKALQN